MMSLEQVEEVKIICSARTYAQLKTLAVMVCNRHYSWSQKSEREDLIIEGILKGVKLIEGGQYDPNRSTWKNYLYTGMRNEMTNFLYRKHRNGKEVLTAEMPVHCVSKVGINNPNTNLDFSVIYDLTYRLAPRHGNYALPLMDYLSSLGIDTINSPIIREKPDPISPVILESLVAGALWTMQESFR